MPRKNLGQKLPTGKKIKQYCCALKFGFTVYYGQPKYSIF